MVYQWPLFPLKFLLHLYRHTDIIEVREVFHLILDDLMRKSGLSRYRLAVTAGIPHATLNDICSGKTKLERCSAETVYKLAKALDVPME